MVADVICRIVELKILFTNLVDLDWLKFEAQQLSRELSLEFMFFLECVHRLNAGERILS